MCVCSQCDKTFTQNNNLITHPRTQTWEKSYKFMDCNKAFTVNSCLIKCLCIHIDENHTNAASVTRLSQ